MSRKYAVVAGAFDTKGEDYAFVRTMLEDSGLSVLLVDFGVLGAPDFAADIDRATVADAGGASIDIFQDGRNKDRAMRVMSDGLRCTVRRLYDEGRLHGIISLGGSGGTSVAAAAMRELPLGVPKVMVSTLGGGDVSAYAGQKDIVFVPSIVDVAGLNSISRQIYANAAGALIGMINSFDAYANQDKANQDNPIVVASMFGNTTTAVEHAKAVVAPQGYEFLIFHATGAGGRMMESLINEGRIQGAYDLTTTELADHVCGGVFSAGAERCLAAPRAGIATVIAPGCVDMANFHGPETVPARYRDRKLYEWNPDITLLRTNADENAKIGKLLAAAANEATGQVAVFLPLNGVSMLDSPDSAFWDPEANAACFDAIRSGVRKDVQVIEIDANINDTEFSGAAAEKLLEFLAMETKTELEVG